MYFEVKKNFFWTQRKLPFHIFVLEKKTGI